jgi:hypothetical protein
MHGCTAEQPLYLHFIAGCFIMMLGSKENIHNISLQNYRSTPYALRTPYYIDANVDGKMILLFLKPINESEKYIYCKKLLRFLCIIYSMTSI